MERFEKNVRIHVRKNYPRTRIEDIRILKEETKETSSKASIRHVVVGALLTKKGEELKLVEYSRIAGEDEVLSFIIDQNGKITPVSVRTLTPAQVSLAMAVAERYL